MKPDCPNCHTGSCYHIEDSKKIAETEMTYDGDVEFKIRQVNFMGDFTNWEGELLIKGELYCEATAPTFWGVMDCLTEYIFEQTVKDDHPVLDHNWFKKDANDR